ncbi:MAG TPA: restriction endonuclease [Burkholderiales bacterium]|nr:restriction endonuclease [Burkholderiales bacterium]
METPPTLAVQLLRGAVRFASLPFTWPAAALRRGRGLLGARGESAERAKFDTRKWTRALLKHLDWRRFEETCAAYFEAQGFSARVTLSAAGGPADIALCAGGSDTPSVLLHCKAWDAYRVGIKALQALRAAMAAAGIGEGLLATPGRFTQEAEAFAAKENIKLLDGATLLARFAELGPEQALALLKFATQGDFLTPTCPHCSIKMTSRKSTQGGRKFWGCHNYPRCKQTFFGSAPA